MTLVIGAQDFLQGARRGDGPSPPGRAEDELRGPGEREQDDPAGQEPAGRVEGLAMDQADPGPGDRADPGDGQRDGQGIPEEGIGPPALKQGSPGTGHAGGGRGKTREELPKAGRQSAPGQPEEVPGGVADQSRPTQPCSRVYSRDLAALQSSISHGIQQRGRHKKMRTINRISRFD